MQTLSDSVLFNRRSSPSLSPPGLLSQLISHHSEGHELEDAPTASLLQALDTLLNEALYKLCVRSSRLGTQDGGNEEEQIGWREKNKWLKYSHTPVFKSFSWGDGCVVSILWNAPK